MTDGHLHGPRKLERSDDRKTFASGATELDEWFAKYAWQNQRAKNAVVYVATLDDLVVGYYAICSGGISADQAPDGFAKGRPTNIPIVLLARLAVDRRAQDRGLGGQLFRDAITRSVAASDAIGAAALVIHARDENARDFYLKHADLLDSPVDPMHLILPLRGLN